jgi:hypothetical protein
MTTEISLVELQLHVAEALAALGIGVAAFEIQPDSDGGWRIQLNDGDLGEATDIRLLAVAAVEMALSERYKVHRLSRGGAYGG